ncbi:MAG TPA: L,D-transpeptidase family protein [Blastocatellia bacterium]|nr:L,D-transpeptidase family protein [Blastocatellia bacterium]
MNTILRSLSAAVALLILLGGVGCVTESSNTTANRQTKPIANTNAASATSTTPEPTPEKTATAPPNAQPVTLPVLDAFFAQENFAAELKTKLQLTDEQVNKLKNIARQETSKLRESDNHDEYAGRTTAAREDAYEKSKAAIGEEKTQALIAFVNERWSGDASPSTPASITPAATPRDALGVPQDKRVVVNAPAFRMDLFEGGELIKSYKIGIGYPEFPLPTGLRKADTIIFNPTWTPPDEPWVESPGSKVKVGERVEAGDKLNPLGPIKIPIGLPSLIHGGKAPAKLGGFASHGCVGLTNSQIQDFAKRLGQLGGTEISDGQFAEYQKNKTETKAVKLSKAVPIELRYETITVENGKLHIYRDVYDRGTNTEENLRNVLQPYGVTLDQLSEPKRAAVTRALGQMARDAGGKPVPDATATNKSDSAKGNSSALSSTSASPKKGDKSKEESRASNIASGKVTRTIKGGKEVVVEIPALLGKGYPAPVDLDAGVASKKAAPSSRRRR